MITEMTPLLNRCKSLRRLRYTDEWFLLDPKIIAEAYGWLKVTRKNYWIPCANYYREFTEDQWDVMLAGFGRDITDVKVFKRNLKALHSRVTSNERPFFFKIALVNIKIKEIKKCQKK